MTWIDEAKKRAAEKAVEHIKDDMIIGLGSGSTAAKAVKIIGDNIKGKKLSGIFGVPTSYQTMQEAIQSGIPLTTLDEHPQLDLGIDGADQIDLDLNAIKGGGAALLREKVVASICTEYILIADERKKTSKLGQEQPIPIEVHPLSKNPVLKRLKRIGGKPEIRNGTGKLGPVITDNGNMIFDVYFEYIDDLNSLDQELHYIPGVLETGLFLGFADIAYIGQKNGVETLMRR